MNQAGAHGIARLVDTVAALLVVAAGGGLVVGGVVGCCCCEAHTERSFFEKDSEFCLSFPQVDSA